MSLNLIFPLNSFSQSSVQNLSNVAQVSGGAEHFCALISTNDYLDENARGTVKCWGSNGSGRLGNGSTQRLSSVPVDVLVDGTSNLLSSVKQVSAGSHHSCAIVEENTEDEIWCWGSGADGKLGINSTASKNKAVKAVFSESHRFVKVVAGANHTCTVTDDSFVYCWGSNSFGQLGNSTTTNSLIPVKANISNVIDIAIASVFYGTTCVVVSNTDIYCWGDSKYGMLGDGTNLSSSTSNPNPQLATHLGSGYIKIFGNKNVRRLAALKTDGTFLSWGSGGIVSRTLNNVKEIAIAYRSSIVLLNDGVINGIDSISNIRTVGAAGGESHLSYCAVNFLGFIYCWGNNNSGELGNGDFMMINYPKEVTSLPNSFYESSGILKKIRAGGNASLVVTSENGVNKAIVFGNSYIGSYNPTYVKGIGGSGEFSGFIKDLTADLASCFVIKEDNINRVACFGLGGYGIGDGTLVSKTYPVYVKGVNGESEKLEGELLGERTCKVLLDNEGKIACWGINAYGQLGNQKFGVENGTNEKGESMTGSRFSSVPVLVQDRDSYLDTENPLTGAVDVVNGSFFSCAIMEDSTVKCWGKSDKYLGNQTDSNSTVGSLRPVTVIVDNNGTPLSGVIQLSIQSYTVYALKNDGSVVKWGKYVSKRPVAVLGLSSGVKKIASGTYYTCFIMTENSRDILKCLGNNNYGQLGDNTFTDSSTPVTVVGSNGDSEKLINVTDVGCGSNHTCAIANDKLYCWGSSSIGQTGILNFTTETPELVPRTYIISGTVYVADGVTPMVGATVSAGTLGSTTTGDDGTFSILAPYGGTYTISVKKSDLSFKVDGEEVSYATGTVTGNIDSLDFIAQGLCKDGGTAGVDCVTCRDDLDCEANFHCENNGLVTSSCVANPPPCSSDALFDSIGSACTSGLGVCKRTGTYYCSGISATSDVLCNATTNFDKKTTEICDTLDNDCDGEVDENYVCDIDKDGVPNSEDKCPNLDDKATFTYTGGNEVYYGNTYRNDEDMDQDGIVNCLDECVDDLPEEDLFLDLSFGMDIKGLGCEETPKGGVTPTVTPTNTPTNTPTKTSTFTNTFTLSFTNTNTPTITNTFSPSFTFTNTNTPTITDTFTSTFTLSNTITKTLTPTFTNTVTPEKIKIVTPKTRLKKPVEVRRVKNHVRFKFEEFDGASFDDLLTKDLNINYQYLIHIRKLKRLGNKDKNYQYGRKKLSLQKLNVKTFKNLDKGIYSVRYRIVMKKNNITRKTKWCGRNLIVF